MIVRKDGTYETNVRFPSTNWYENETEIYVVDEATEDGRLLAQKITELYPYFDMIVENGELIDVVENEELRLQYLRELEELKESKPPTESERLQALEEALLILLFDGSDS